MESELSILGVPGRIWRATSARAAAGCWEVQKWVSAARPIAGYGKGAMIRAQVRFDDECRNKHNTFAITAEVNIPGRRDCVACGCLHDDIARIFPELAPLIKWHLFSSTGPVHYVANALYHAGARDHRGLLKGEPSNNPRTLDWFVQFGKNPIRHALKRSFAEFLQECAKGGIGGPFDLEVIQVPHKNQSRAGEYQFAPKYTFGGYGEEWHGCPFDSEDEALQFLRALQCCEPRFVQVQTVFGEGKTRDLEAARSVAVWPEATDEELCAPDLKERLLARLPGLVETFRAVIEGAGLLWAPSSDNVTPQRRDTP